MAKTNYLFRPSNRNNKRLLPPDSNVYDENSPAIIITRCIRDYFVVRQQSAKPQIGTDRLIVQCCPNHSSDAQLAWIFKKKCAQWKL